MRPAIKYKDVDLTEVIGMSPADGWLAEINAQVTPVLFWLLLRNGELVGLVSEMPNSIQGDLRAADRLPMFTGYRRVRAA